MDIDAIKEAVRLGQFVVSQHAEIEAEADNLELQAIVAAVQNGEILETYADTGRGESCLIVGDAGDEFIHVVCGWRESKVIIITVYIPIPPKFPDPWTRASDR